MIETKSKSQIQIPEKIKQILKQMYFITSESSCFKRNIFFTTVSLSKIIFWHQKYEKVSWTILLNIQFFYMNYLIFSCFTRALYCKMQFQTNYVLITKNEEERSAFILLLNSAKKHNHYNVIKQMESDF